MFSAVCTKSGFIGQSQHCSDRMSSVRDRLVNLPRPIAVALTVSGFLILINVFGGLHKIWFHWPVAALLRSDELRQGSASEPASPHCSSSHGFGLPDSNQCFRRSAQNLVSLASRSIAQIG